MVKRSSLSQKDLGHTYTALVEHTKRRKMGANCLSATSKVWLEPLKGSSIQPPGSQLNDEFVMRNRIIEIDGSPTTLPLPSALFHWLMHNASMSTHECMVLYLSC